MKRVGEQGSGYAKTLSDRAKQSRAYRKYQAIGLEVADILEDRAHKALYIKLAKEYGSERVIGIAKTVAENQNVRNKGAYFMKVLHSDGNPLNKK